ncbi:hypothetical protein OIU79_023100 [Salix purpurea]|uniref:Secreted protein n=1 Tax=Salix purpurea TaxID=77065 RepID=A0A9Q0WHB0_SALPP|nr:hypothetical protein OIU79_023100 [Salix purpurea]
MVAIWWPICWLGAAAVDDRGKPLGATGRRGKESEIVVRPRGTQPWGMAESVAGEGKETMAGRRGLMIGGKAGQPSAQRRWLPTAGVGVLTGKGSSWSVAGEKKAHGKGG